MHDPEITEATLAGVREQENVGYMCALQVSIQS